MWRRTMALVLATALTGAGIWGAEAGFLGVEITDAVQGVRVTRVIPGSPAQAFGLRPGYVIVGIGLEPVRSADDFVARTRSLEPGQWTTLRVAASGTVATSMITTQDRLAAEEGARFKLAQRGVLDIAVADHEREVAGVRLVEVQRGGAGFRGGLLVGDVVLAVNGKRTEDTEAFLAEVSRHAGLPTAIALMRRERAITVVVVPDAMDPREVFASIPEIPTDVADNGTHWCERSQLQSVLCIAGAIGGILVIGSILDDDTDTEAESAKAKAERERRRRERQTIGEYERAIDTSEIRRRSLPD